MRTEGKVSKVAICPNCNGYVLACHVDCLTYETEKDFTDFTNEGFIVKIETIEETQKRKYAAYSECSKDKCNKERYDLRSWVCDWGIYDNQEQKFIGKPIERYIDVENIFNIMFSGIKINQ